jgi:hypothetical protein
MSTCKTPKQCAMLETARVRCPEHGKGDAPLSNAELFSVLDAEEYDSAEWREALAEIRRRVASRPDAAQ